MVDRTKISRITKDVSQSVILIYDAKNNLLWSRYYRDRKMLDKHFLNMSIDFKKELQRRVDDKRASRSTTGTG